jgi:M6 family metalloprotease-like protein
MLFLPSGSIRTTVSVGLLLLAATAVLAAPHNGDPFVLEQPDGTEVSVRVWGDEFYQRIENLDGYTLIRDPRTGKICYADLAADGKSFVSTGVVVHEAPPAGLVRGLRLPPADRAEAAWSVRNQFAAEEAASLAGKSRNPGPANQGNVLGLTLIIDFTDEPWSVPAADFDGYLNLEGYSGYGNNGSVRDYFFDVSGGILTYTNWVPPTYMTAPFPKTYYEDPNVQYGLRGRELVRWALDTLDDQGHDFSRYDSNGDGYIDAINVFYAGNPTGGWSVGLWPHSGGISWSADGVQSFKYQITNIGSAPTLATFCHENGHMIMLWPDLYDYGGESSGVGRFCLMCSTGSSTNPVRPCAYLRAEAGWETPVILEGLQTGLPASHDDMNIYKIPNSGVDNEYYMVECRFRSGRDGSIPDSGLAIWHIDEFGSNNDEFQLPGQHYLVTLVQADGRWDLENGSNQGDSTDLWKAPTYVEFNPSTVPPATWWDGRDAPIYIDGISASGPYMTFQYRAGLGTMGVTVEPLPAAINAIWTLEGPDGYLVEGEGNSFLLVWVEGMYTLTWGDMPGWNEPDPLQSSFDMVDGGAPAHFTGIYTDPPFALVPGGVAADPGPTAAVSLVDVDGDGDEDLHVVNAGQADRLLRNDGGMVFTDITPVELADTGFGSAAAWADYDNDGDRDVYLTRTGEPNRLMEQEGGSFTDVTSLSFGLDDADDGTDASWCDVDSDGLLDLYLVKAGGENVFFGNFGDIGSGHPLLITQLVPDLNDPGPGRAAVWCDYDLDGDRDIYLVNFNDENLLLVSYAGTVFESSGEWAMSDAGAGQDAVWGDFDNDGDWDAYTVNADDEDVFVLGSAVSFVRQFDPLLTDDGPGRSVAAADFDNDGALDLYVARDGAPDMLLFGDGGGGFVRSSLAGTETDGSAVTAVCADLDDDGGVDVYVARDGAENLILRNQIVGRGHWLAIDLRGDPTNHDAIGARVRLVTGGFSQLREIQAGDGRGEAARIVHFGLGASSAADSVVVTWPDGEQTVRVAQVADRTLVIRQTEDPSGVDEGNLPGVTRLRGAYPNPLNPQTTIAFELASAGPVRLTIYGLDGRRVIDLVREELPAGPHAVSWQGRDGDGRQVASGTYLLQLQTREGAYNSRMTLVK